MEGHGMMTAAHMNEVPSAVVRGISDLLGNKAEAETANSQAMAAHRAASLLFQLLPGLAPGKLEAVSHRFSFDEITQHVSTIHRQMEKHFLPDIIVTMSGPGSAAAAYCGSLNSRDIPIFVAVTFPVPGKGGQTDSAARFAEHATKANWRRIVTTKWEIFLPGLLFDLPHGTKVVIFDDRVVTGAAQRTLEQILTGIGHQVARAAVFTSTAEAASLRWSGAIADGDFSMPWGSKNGRR
jgi:hypothetical protein